MLNSKFRESGSSKRLYRLCILGLSVTAMSSGCSTFQKDPGTDSSSWSISKLWKKEYQRPQKIAVIWSPDILTVAGKPPTRGFGGRVFFYNERSQAIPVEGDLIVHGYLGDPEQGIIHEQADKTFIFTAEQLTSHFSPSQLGASYSIWIPWDDARGYQMPVNLIPSFKTKEGYVIQGAPAKMVLPGKTPEADSMSRDGLPAQTISFQQSSTPTNNGVKLPEFGSQRDWEATKSAEDRPRMRTTTIEVPKSASLAKRRPSQRLTLELGGNPATVSSSDNDAGDVGGVSVGGRAQEPAEKPASAADSRIYNSASQTPKESLQAPISQETLPATRVRSLPAPNSAGASPFALQQLPETNNFVRPASFFEQNRSKQGQ